MKRKLGLRSSAGLILCRIIAFALFFTAVGIPTVSYFLNFSASLSEEEKKDLMESHAFKIAQKMAANPEIYGNLEDVTLIEDIYVSWSDSRDITKKYSYSMLRVKSKGNREIYVSVRNEYSLITQESFEGYNNSSGRFNYSRNATGYVGAELKFIKQEALKGGN